MKFSYIIKYEFTIKNWIYSTKRLQLTTYINMGGVTKDLVYKNNTKV